MIVRASRYHDISCGHRVVGHENKCKFLHGHNYRIHFHCEGVRDSIGRVLDFSVIKSELCDWLERNWDHKFLMWEDDPLWPFLLQVGTPPDHPAREAHGSFFLVPFNPTAENMAKFLLMEVGPERLAHHGVKLVKVVVEETRKCSAEARLPQRD